jgi:hypothetical protein
MNYTKQDVFRHKESGTILLYVGEDPDGNVGIYEFSASDDYHYWSLDEVEYLGRSSKIVLFKDANLTHEYYVGGCGSGCFNGTYKMLKLDADDKRISYKFFDEDVREEQWCRHILNVPFSSILNHIDLTATSVVADGYSSKLTCSLTELKESMTPRESLNSTNSTLVKQPKALM